MAKCKATTISGQKCKSAALKGGAFCLFHAKMPSSGSKQMDRIRKQLRRRRK